MDVAFTPNYFLVGGDVSVTSETLLMINFVNLKIKPAYFFRSAHKSKIYVYIFMIIYTYINIYTVSKKNKVNLVHHRTRGSVDPPDAPKVFVSSRTNTRDPSPLPPPPTRAFLWQRHPRTRGANPNPDLPSPSCPLSIKLQAKRHSLAHPSQISPPPNPRPATASSTPPD
jgi:hypothetical protein